MSAGLSAYTTTYSTSTRMLCFFEMSGSHHFHHSQHHLPPTYRLPSCTQWSCTKSWGLSNSNFNKPKWHRSQCCGQKCTRMRCAQVKIVNGKFFKLQTFGCIRRFLLHWRIKKKYKRPKFKPAFVDEATHAGYVFPWAPGSAIGSANPPAMLEAIIKRWKQHSNAGEMRPLKAWTSAIESTLHLYNNIVIKDWLRLGLAYSSSIHLWVFSESMLHAWFSSVRWSAVTHRATESSSAIKYRQFWALGNTHVKNLRGKI